MKKIWKRCVKLSRGVIKWRIFVSVIVRDGITTITDSDVLGGVKSGIYL